MIFPVLSATGFAFKLPEIFSSRVLIVTLKSFDRERSRRGSSSPLWDLDRVLRDLFSFLFKILGFQSLRTMINRVRFLVAFVFATMIGDFWILHSKVGFQGQDAILPYRPYFAANSDLVSNLFLGSFEFHCCQTSQLLLTLNSSYVQLGL